MGKGICGAKRELGVKILIAVFILIDLLLTIVINSYSYSLFASIVKYLVLCFLMYVSYWKFIGPLVNGELAEKVERQVAYIGFLERINHLMVSNFNFQQNFAEFVLELQTQIDFDDCQVFKVEENHEYYNYGSDDGVDRVFGHQRTRPSKDPALEEVVKIGKSRVFKELNVGRARSAIYIPMFLQKKLIGIFVLSSFQVNKYSENDLIMLEPVVERLTAALQNCLLYQETLDLSLKDYLTGVANRRALDIQLEYEFRRAKRYHEPFSLLVVDIDYFKQFNDTYGHLAGDEALKHVASLMKEEVREIDLVSRFGGEEFVILMPETAREQAAWVAERIRMRVSNYVFLPGQDSRLTVSIGVSTFSEEMEEMGEMLNCADLKMYSAKSHGRNKVVMIG